MKVEFSELRVDVEDIDLARELAIRLRDDRDFYMDCSKYAYEKSRDAYGQKNWLKYMEGVLNG